MYIAISVVLLVLFLYLAFRLPGTSILTSIPASILCLVVITLMEGELHPSGDEFLPTLIAMAVFPATLLTVAFIGLRTNAEERRWPHFIAIWVVKILFYILLLAGLSFLLNILGVVIWFMYIILQHKAVVAFRRSIALDVISTIGSCTRQNLPLPMAMQTAAAGYKGKRRRIFLGIAKWLTEGYSLGHALKAAYPKCPAYITTTIDAAEKVNQLPEAIRSIEAEVEHKTDESAKIRPVDSTYPLTVFTVAISIMLGLMIFIIPTFAEVLDDMGEGAKLPKITQILVDISDMTLSNNGALLIIIVFVLLILNLGLPWLKNIYRKIPRRVDNPPLLIKLADSIKWHLPILHWFEFNYSVMRATGFIRVSLDAGCTVNDAIRRACQLDLNNCFRKRMKNWLARVEQGQNISNAAIDTGMGNSIAWAFDESINAGNTPRLLGMLEKFYRSNYNFKANILRSIGFPAMVILLSIMVAIIAFGMFMPIIAIITALM